MTNHKTLLSIHYLRGLAALLVVIFHFRGFLNNTYAQQDLGTRLLSGGAFGVDLFFIISGFIIVYATNIKSENTPTLFAVRRFFRIYPLFFICISIGFLTIYSGESTAEKLRALFLIHQNYHAQPPTYEYNMMGPAWTLTYEIYFYTIFCIGMIISHKHRALITSLLILTQVIGVQLIANGDFSFSADRYVSYTGNSIIHAILQFSSSTMFFEFIYGMLICQMFSIKRKLFPKKILKIVFWAGIVLFFIFYSSNYKAGFGPQGFGVWALCLFLAMMAYEKACQIKTNKTFYFLGDISYSLYISHYLVLGVASKYDLLLWHHTEGFSKVIFMTALSILTAAALHKAIEKPAIKAGKSITKAIKAAKRNQHMEGHNYNLKHDT